MRNSSCGLLAAVAILANCGGGENSLVPPIEAVAVAVGAMAKTQDGTGIYTLSSSCSDKLLDVRQSDAADGSCAQRRVPTATNAKEIDIAAALPAQPRGQGPACSDRSAWTAQTVRTRLAPAVVEAEKLLQASFPAWSDDAYLEYSRTGVRLAGEQMMDARKGWLYPLVMAECVEASGRFIGAIEKTLTELTTQPTWTWPASDGNLRNFRDRNYDVDLNAADTAREIAQTLYLLGDRLSANVRTTTRNALETRVFAPVRASLATGKDNVWLRVGNNWNAVCLAGVVSAALATLPDRNDRAAFVTAATTHIPRYIADFTADGYTPEGPSYWNYGFSHFAELREALHAATSGAVDLFADPKTRLMALYGYRIEMSPGNAAAFGDAWRGVGIDSVTRAYINAAFGFGQPQRLRELPVPSKQTWANQSTLTVAYQLLFAQAAPAPTAHLGFPSGDGLRSYFDAVGVLVSRPAADNANAIAATIKSGGNGNHSHNDIGSYTIGLGNEQPAGDTGKTVYSAKTFGPDRYKIRAINSWGHTVPVVAGQLQLEANKVKPRVLGTKFTGTVDEMVIDLAPAYAVPSLSSLTRSYRHDVRVLGEEPATDRTHPHIRTVHSENRNGDRRRIDVHTRRHRDERRGAKRLYPCRL
jgi:hypothetical protein